MCLILILSVTQTFKCKYSKDVEQEDCQAILSQVKVISSKAGFSLPNLPNCTNLSTDRCVFQEGRSLFYLLLSTQALE